MPNVYKGPVDGRQSPGTQAQALPGQPPTTPSRFRPTYRALTVDTGDKEPIWLPKSQVEYYKAGTTEIVTMPHWLAKEKGLI